MKEDILKVINNYGVIPQLKYFQSEVFELNEAIIQKEYSVIGGKPEPLINTENNHIYMTGNATTVYEGDIKEI